MKFSYLSLFALLLALMPLNISAGDMGFYTDYAAALKMEKPELRVNKLLDMLDKYPERAEELYPFFTDSINNFTFTQEYTRKVEALRKKYPENYSLNFTLRQLFPFNPTEFPEIKRLLLNCPLSPLSDFTENAIIELSSKLYRYHQLQGTCHKELEFFDRFYQRMNQAESTAKFKWYLLLNALDFYRQALWESDCVAPTFAAWKNLPMRGAKERYHFYFNEFLKLEADLEFPYSLLQLEIYIHHQPSHAGRYAAKLVGTRHLQLTGMILAAATVAKTPELFDHYLPQLKKGTPFAILSAMHYAHHFHRFEPLKQLLPADEFDLVKKTVLKDYSGAAKAAGKIIASGKVSHPEIINHMVDIVWNTQDRNLLRQIWQFAEKDPQKLLAYHQANSIAYTAAVLNVDLAKAEKLSHSAMNRHPNSATLDTYAYILYRQKQYTAARNFIIRAMQEIDPGESCAPIYLHAAEIELAAAKDKKRAAWLLDRALKCSKENNYEFNAARAAELQEILEK
ncbi:MAG: hypothetical protein E7042_06905 [Lentisphaerae bacterium]|nr:hypothetical protein [Lentisphaerota bacterium]